ncbi:MAG: HAD-IA family hydrolase [Acetobacteraceae bacterium]
MTEPAAEGAASGSDMHPMRTILFDLDGTLVDSAADLHAAADRMAERLGLAPFSRAEIVSWIGDGARALVEKALRARAHPFDRGAFDAFLADYTANAAVETRPFDGIDAALDALRAGGFRLAVCTNKPEAAARALLQALGLARHFAAIGGGDSFPVRKPDPRHLLATLDAAGGRAEAALMVGDHRNDVEAANGALIPCVFAVWGYGTVQMAEGAAATAAHPADLPALADRLVPSR